MTRIFISYRREDSETFTGRLCDSLRGHFGHDSVFLDVDNIPYGVDFRTHLRGALSECDAVLVVMGSDWLQSKTNGRRRLDDPQDPVRVEVETAFEKDIPVIPITIKDTPVPDEEELPDTLRPLAYRNACAVDTGRDFHPHVERLIASLGDKIASSPAAPAKPRRMPTPKTAESPVTAPRGLSLGCATQSGIGLMLTISSAAVLLVMLNVGGLRDRFSPGVSVAMAEPEDTGNSIAPGAEPDASESLGQTQTQDLTDSAVIDSESIVKEFSITHIGNEGKTATFAKPLFEDRTTRFQDDVSVNAQFRAPTFCYLFALNPPKGAVQLCYPENEDDVQAAPITSLRFPEDEDLAFGLTDGLGHQAFVLVTSTEPLPPFAQWRSEHLPEIDWETESIEGNWIYRDGELKPKSFVDSAGGPLRKTRGAVRKKNEPTDLKEVFHSIVERGPYEIEGVIFEVTQ